MTHEVPIRPPAMTAQELQARLTTAFPEAFHAESGLRIEAVWHRGCRVRQVFHGRFLRPGGTVSGPTMMHLTDVSMYIAVLASVGWVPLAVTTQININFMRKPAARDLVAEARLLKLGKRLAVGEVSIYSEGIEEMVAHATSTYALPGDR